MSSQFDFFVSYSRNVYSDIVEPIIVELETYGLKLWVDKTEVTLGTKIKENLFDILSQIKSWIGSIVFIDPSYTEKEWCRWESEFFINNKIVCCPVLYKMRKEDLPEAFVYYKLFNLATVFSKEDISITVDKILMAYITFLAEPERTIKISSSILNNVIRRLHFCSSSIDDQMIICDVICQILFSVCPDLISGNHNIIILANIIHHKVKKCTVIIYVQGMNTYLSKKQWTIFYVI